MRQGKYQGYVPARAALSVTALDTSTGVILWQNEKQGGFEGTDGSYVAVDSDGARIYWTGALQPYPPISETSDIVTYVLDARTGIQLTEVKYSAPLDSEYQSDETLSLALAPDDGHVYISGFRDWTHANPRGVVALAYQDEIVDSALALCRK